MPITFADSPAFDALGLENRPALILGMDNLRILDRVAIDFDSRSVLFDLPDDIAGNGWQKNRNCNRRIGR